MKQTILQIAARLLVVMTIASTASVAWGQPANRHGHNFPHGHSKKHRELKKRDVSKEKIAYLYGNHICPLSLDYVDSKSFVQYENEEDNVYGRIYLCCDGCKESAEKNVAELYQKVYGTDKETGKPEEAWDVQNSRCPVKGTPALVDVTTEYNGMLLHFHAPECVDDFLKSPDSGLSRILPKAKQFAYLPPARSRMAHR